MQAEGSEHVGDQRPLNKLGEKHVSEMTFRALEAPHVVIIPLQQLMSFSFNFPPENYSVMLFSTHTV